MLDVALRRFEPFRDFTRPELATAAHHTRLLRLPARRWLLRPGGELTGSYYLLRGTLRCFEPERRVRHGSKHALRAVYPGTSAIETCSITELLWVDMRTVAFLLGLEGEEPEAAPDQAAGVHARLEPWERRLLRAPGLRRLQPSTWQRLFSRFEERPVPEGEDVIAFGAPADGFYVLKSGSAVVHRRGATLAHLQPGDVFGEDALVLGAVRNASVTMTTDGRVLSLPTSALPAILADGIVRAVATPGTGRVVDVASYEARGAMPDGSALPLGGLREALDRLDPAEPCYLTGGRAEERVLAAFILTSRGFDAWCVEPPGPISRATR
jgi:CRP-like cAMP-binding protein